MSDGAEKPNSVQTSPAHAAPYGWRGFLKELGTIVLGVVLALAASQAVEYFRWRADVAEAREFIASEMAENTISAVIRMRTAKCVERRLDVLAAILDDAARTGQLPPVGDIGLPPRRLWRNGIWESVVASQTATHFSRQELADLGSIYKLVERGGDYSRLEVEPWSDLSAMVGPGRRLDPVSEAELRRALGRARTYNRMIEIVAAFMMEQINSLRLPFGAGDLKIIDAAMRQSLTSGKATWTNPAPPYLMCQPLGAAPPHYGQAPQSAIRDLMDDNAKLNGIVRSLHAAQR